MTVPSAPDADTCEGSCVHPQAVVGARAAKPDDALGTGELCVCDLVAVAGTGESAASHQLRLL